MPKDTVDSSPPPKGSKPTPSKTTPAASKTSKSSKSSKLVKPHDGSKNSKGELVFADVPDFRPNRTPKEVLQAGSFGGTYFRPIYSSVTGLKYTKMWLELPQNWLEGLNVKKTVASSIYDE